MIIENLVSMRYWESKCFVIIVFKENEERGGIFVFVIGGVGVDIKV